MARSLANFIVGIGADVSTFKKGTREVDNEMRGIRTSSLAMNATIAGAFSAIGMHALNTAQDVNDLQNAMMFSDADLQYVYNYGNAIERLGGNASTALQEYKQLESMIDRLARLGDADKLVELATLGIRGDDAQLLMRAKNVEEFNNSLAEVLMNSDDVTRRMTQNALGFSDQTMKLLVSGAQSFNEELAKSESLTGNISALREDSAALVTEWNKLWQSGKGFGNELATSSIPAVTDLLKKTNEVGESIGSWYRGARDFTSTVTSDFIEKHKPVDTFSEKINDSIFSSLDRKIEKNMTITNEDIHNYQFEKGDITPQGLTPIQLQMSVPTLPMSSSNMTSQTQQLQQRQPIQLESTSHIVVELDGRAIATAVETVQQEDYFIMNEGIKSTTGR